MRFSIFIVKEERIIAFGELGFLVYKEVIGLRIMNNINKDRKGVGCVLGILLN